MKKLVLISVLFALFAGALYAQELRFDGYINSGLGVINAADDDTVVKPFGVDSESNGYRFRLSGSYTNEAKNAGARFRLQSQRRIDQAGYFSIPYVYGWAGFFDSKITITGGIVDDGTWTTADWWWNDDQGEGLGLLLKITPVEGLSFGAGAFTISQQSGGSNNILTLGGNLPNFGNILIKAEDAKYTFNAAYTIKDAFRLGVSFRTKNQAGWAPYNADPPANYPYNGREETSQLIGEFRLLAVKDLTAVIVGVFDKLDDFSDSGNITLSETFSYKINSEINAGLDMVQFLYNRPVDVDPGLLFHLWGSYSIGSIVPRVDLTYFIGGRSNTSQQYHRRGYAAAAENYSVFGVRPSVRINLDSRTFVEIGDLINLDFDKNNGYAGEDSQLTNIFYIDVKWSF